MLGLVIVKQVLEKVKLESAFPTADVFGPSSSEISLKQKESIGEKKENIRLGILHLGLGYYSILFQNQY